MPSWRVAPGSRAPPWRASWPTSSERAYSSNATTASAPLPVAGVRHGSCASVAPPERCIGIDFGKRHVRVAAADLSHAILAEAERPMPTDEPAEIGLETAVELVDEVLGEAGVSRADVIGVGLGLPGPIELSTGRVGSSSILPGWVGVRAAEALSSRLDLPVQVDNDANLGALAELHWGAATGYRNAAYLKVSTGIGAGLIVDGRLFHGADGMAGEIGHTIVQEHGPFCRCGKRGCLETLAGAAALVELLQATHGPELTTQQLLDAAAAGDSAARRVLADAGRYIGTAVATLCDLLNPELIVVGGQLSAAGDVLLDPLREQVHRHAIPATSRHLRHSPGRPGTESGATGRARARARDGSWRKPPDQGYGRALRLSADGHHADLNERDPNAL